MAQAFRWLFIALGLTGCSSVFSNCPTPVQYSLQFQKEAAKEVESLAVDSKIIVLLKDYAEERARLRACQ